MREDISNTVSAMIHLTGSVQSADFPHWVARHAYKLGLVNVATQAVSSGIEITAEGAEEMLQALALGASLGPKSVIVESVSITIEGRSPQPQGFL